MKTSAEGQLKQIFLQNKPYQQILLKIKEYYGKWQNLNYLEDESSGTEVPTDTRVNPVQIRIHQTFLQSKLRPLQRGLHLLQVI